MLKLSSIFLLLTISRRCFFCGSFLLFMFHVYLCYAVLSVLCSLVITCWKRADLLALLCVVFSCAFVTFPYGVPFQVWYLIVYIPDLCLPLYLNLMISNFWYENTSTIIDLTLCMLGNILSLCCHQERFFKIIIRVSNCFDLFQDKHCEGTDLRPNCL